MRGSSMGHVGGRDRQISTDPVIYSERKPKPTGLDWSKHTAPPPAQEEQQPMTVTIGKDANQTATGTYVDAVPVRSIKADQTYQRPLDRARVKRMVAEFDPSLIGVIEVSLRPLGEYAVIDGHHRLETVRTAKGSGSAIACNVHTGLTPEDEARLFYEIDRKRTRLTGWDRWNARRGAGEQVVLDIEGVAAHHGLVIDPAPKNRHLRCVSACEKIVALAGLDNLDETLRICVAAYQGEADSLRAELVHGVALILAFYPATTVDHDRLIAGMQAITARQISAKAAGLREIQRGQLPRLAAHVIVEQYNGRPGPKLTPFLKAFSPHRKDKDLLADANKGARA